MAIKNVRDHYSKLTTSFPINDLLPSLYSKRVITSDQKEQIQKKQLRKEKVSYLLDSVIIPSLELDDTTLYDNLIKVMEDCDDITAHRLAKLLQGTVIVHMYYVCM